MFKKFLAFFMIFLASLSFSADIKEIELLLQKNSFVEAEILLKSAILENPLNEKPYVYLAALYEKQGRNSSAIETLKKAQYKVGSRVQFFFMLGNNFSILKSFEEAEEAYSGAIDLDMDFAPAYLNRANVRNSLDKKLEAVSDYRKYLELDRKSYQKVEVERMIEYLLRKIEDEERAARLAEELRKAEEQRKKELLDDVLNDLSNRDESSNVGVDNTELEDYDFDLELEE